MLMEKRCSPLTQRERVLKTLLAGGVAGCCAKSTVAPFDRVKILLQAHHTHYKHLGVLSTLTRVVSKEGFIGLYRGNGVQMIRIFPYAAAQFAGYEYYKQVLHSHFGQSQLAKLAAGSLAGMTAVLLTYPLDIIRARLAFQVAGEIVYTGIANAFYMIVTREGGFFALYKGIVPTMVGMAPYAGLSFYSFETLKGFLLKHFPHKFSKSYVNSPEQLVLTIPGKLICGGLSGALAQTVSYPLDVTRRRMQLSLMLTESHQYNSWLKTLVMVRRKYGVSRGLYRGLSINYLKATPMVAVSFSVYELMRQLLGLETHLC